MPDTFLDVRDFGVVGDGQTDDTDALQAAADACVGVDAPTLYVPSQLHVRTTAPVDLWRVLQADIRGRIVGDHDGDWVLRVGYLSDQGTPSVLRLVNVRRADGVTDLPDIRVVGLKAGHVTVGATGFLQLYAESGTSPSIGSIAYNQFHLERVHRLELYGADVETGSSWINENTFYGGNLKDLRIVGTNYTHNHNTFVNPTLEQASVYIDGGVSNRLLGCRFEGSVDVELTDRTRDNVIERTWVQNTGNYDVGGITDHGVRNIVGAEQDTRGNRVELFRIDSSVPAVNGSFGLTNRAPGPESGARPGAVPVPGLERLRIPSSWSTYADTGLIPLVSGGTNRSTNDVLSYLDFSSDRSIWRLRVEFYDENRELMTSENDPRWMSTVGAWNWTGSSYFPSGNVARSRIPLLEPGPTYIRVAVETGGSASGPLEYARLTALVIPPGSDGTVKAAGQRMRKGLMQTQRPTAGSAWPGDVVGTPYAVMWLCTGRVDAALASDVSSGATTIPITEATGAPQAGDVAGVVVEDGTTDWRQVTSATGGQMQLGQGLSQDAAAGAQVVAVRWAGMGSG